MQRRRRHNQQFANKNTRHRIYLLKGRIRCSRCGRIYTGVTRQGNSYYYCRGRAKLDWGAQKCTAAGFEANSIEKVAYGAVAGFLQSPEVCLGEMERQRQLVEQTAQSMKKELAELDRKDRVEQEAEAQVLRLAARYGISEDVLQQEVGLIRTRRNWIKEEKGRLTAGLNDLDGGGVDPSALEILRDRLSGHMARGTNDDQRFLLDSLGATIIAAGDGSWELEVEIPKNTQAEVLELQIANERPRLGWGDRSHSKIRLTEH